MDKPNDTKTILICDDCGKEGAEPHFYNNVPMCDDCFTNYCDMCDMEYLYTDEDQGE